ncbi:amidase signature enzyme [Mycena leptocephala]|nr:amidase signature enzyme [Mycena leptocephala]
MAVCIWFPLALILLCAYLARSFSIPSRLGFGLGEAGGPTLPDLYEASVPELQAGLDAGHFSSVDLVKAYFARIEEVNINGPGLRAVIELNPSALKQAELLDIERGRTGKRSDLHGIPILLKKWKANLSEWAHFRGNVASGWSGRGGQASSAYFPHADPCGSSSGSGIATSIGLAANNVVGIKPTLGLTSRAGVIPLSAHQDTIGPMTRSLTDAAIVLSPPVVPDFTKALNKNALKGKRIGVPRRVFLNDSMTENDPSIGVAFEEALITIKALGATVVDPTDLPSADEFIATGTRTRVLNVDFKVQLNQYLEGLIENPSGVRSLADLIKFNDDNPTLEKPEGYEDQSEFVQAEATNGFDAEYFATLARNYDIGSTRGIDFVLKKFNLDAIVLPSHGFTTTPAAIVGYPIVTVPLGFLPDNVTIGSAGPETVYPAPGVPFGLSFLGTAFSDFELISFGFAYEQKTQTRLMRKAYPAAIPKTQLKDVIGKGKKLRRGLLSLLLHLFD